MGDRRGSRNRLIQAYCQAPWRNQVQVVVTILIVIVTLAVAALVYLSISSQTATAGLEILHLRGILESLQRQVADQSAKLAWLSSATLMKARAESLGFEIASPQNQMYIEVPGYPGRQTVILAPLMGTTLPQPLLRASYTQSLWEWLFQGIFSFTSTTGRLQ